MPAVSRRLAHSWRHRSPLAGASFANAAGAVGRLSVTLASVPVLFRVLGTDTFGTWIFVSAVVAFGSVVEGGNAVSTTVLLGRALAEGRPGEAAAVLARSRAVAIAVGVVALAGMASFGYVGAGVFRPMGSDASQIQLALVAGGFLLAFGIIAAPSVGALEAFGHFTAKNVLIAAEATIGAVVSVIVAVATGSVAAMMIGDAVVGAGMMLAYSRLARSHARQAGLPARRMTLRGSAGQARMSVDNALVTVSIGAFQQADRLIVGSVAGAGALGLYGVAVSIGSQLQSLIAVVSQPLTASRSGIGLGARGAAAGRRFRRIISLNAVACLAAAGAGLLLAPIAALVLGVAVAGSLAVSIGIAVCVYATIGLQSPAHYWLLGEGRARQVMVIQVVGAVTGLTAIWVAARVSVEAAVVANFAYAWTTQLLVPAALRSSESRPRPVRVWEGVLLALAAAGIAIALLPPVVEVLLGAAMLGGVGVDLSRRYLRVRSGLAPTGSS